MLHFVHEIISSNEIYFYFCSVLMDFDYSRQN